MAVLGAGLSGASAALLLRSEGANVTVLDSADEKKLLRSTLDNLRAQGVRVICGSDADRNSDKFDIIVTSPGIDPASALGRNFWSRGIDIIGELELGWRSCEIAGHRGHGHQRQDHDDRDAGANAEPMRTKDDCLRQHR